LQVEALKRELPVPLHDAHKSDVFVVGMIALEAASLKRLHSVYDYESGTIIQSEIDHALENLSTSYSR
jgi:hypothetical protein